MTMTAYDPLSHEFDLTVVVTCYNEREYIEETLETVRGALLDSGKTFEVIVIDDCSRDGSADVVEALLARGVLPGVRLHRNATNRGLSNNFVEGAFIGRGRHYRLCCGDNAESREALALIFSQAGKADLVVPYHIDHVCPGKSAPRLLISRLFTGIVNMISGNNIHYYNGLSLFLRYHVMRYSPQSYGFGFQADIVCRLLEQDITYAQLGHDGARDMKPKDSTALSMRNLLSVLHTFVELSIRRFRRMLYGKGQCGASEVPLES